MCLRSLIVTVALGGCIGIARELPAGCQDNSACAAGQVCRDAQCLRLCNASADCFAGEVCWGGVCAAPQGGREVPRISAVVGNGAVPERIRDRLLVSGTGLGGAEFRLEGDVVFSLVRLGEGSDEGQTVALPEDIEAGAYVLTATNQSGTGTQPISLLAEPRTADELRTLLLTVDGIGSGLDADRLDGLDADNFAAAVHSHDDYAPLSHAHAEYATTDHDHADYAALDHSHSEYAATAHSHAGMVTSGSSASFDNLSASSLSLSGGGGNTPFSCGWVTATNGSSNFAQVDCPTSKYVVSGSGWCQSSGAVAQSIPFHSVNGEFGQGWKAVCSAAGTVKVYAYCCYR